MYSTPADGGTNSVDQWARWQPPLPTYEGVYEILVHVPNQNATTWQAPYVIVHRDGTSSAVVDQYGLNNQWVSIGTYRMAAGDYVYTHDATGEAWNQHCTGWCSLGVDAVKFVRRGTTYAPDIRQGNGWSSTFSVRSNGGDARITFNLFDGNGVRKCYGTGLVAAHASIPLACSSISGEHSLVVDGSQDLSVVVHTEGPDRAALDNGFLPQGFGDAVFEQAGPVLYVPAFYKNSFNVNSSLSIQNVGTAATQVTINFVGRTGYPNYNYYSVSIPAGGKITVSNSVIPAASWLGSLRLTSSVSTPITAKVYEDRTVSPAFGRSFNASRLSQSLVYVPAAYRNQWGFNTGLVVQNLGGASTNVTLTYCERTVTQPANCPTSTLNNLGPLQAAGVALTNVPGLNDGWTGSVKVQSSNGMPIAVAVTNSNNVGGYDFTATGRGGRTVYLPYAARSANGYSTGYTVRNISGANINVQALYYNENGSRFTAADESFSLASAQVHGNAQIQNSHLPNGWRGSILLVATGDIVAIMRADSSNSVSAYNGIVR